MELDRLYQIYSLSSSLSRSLSLCLFHSEAHYDVLHVSSWQTAELSGIAIYTVRQISGRLSSVSLLFIPPHSCSTITGWAYTNARIILDDDNSALSLSLSLSLILGCSRIAFMNQHRSNSTHGIVFRIDIGHGTKRNFIKNYEFEITEL